jgi:hypothetical protein
VVFIGCIPIFLLINHDFSGLDQWHSHLSQSKNLPGTKRSRRRRDGEDFALGAPMASLRIRMGGSGSSAMTKKTVLEVSVLWGTPKHKPSDDHD